MKLFRRLSLIANCLALSVTALCAQPKPNIIFILTDDLGYGDLGSFGQQMFATPNLDRFAAEGARLTHHYSAAPVCAPSRASLLLGVHQGHANVRDNQFDKALEDNHTLATVLRRAGYATAVIGKWGLHGQPASSTTGADPNTPAHPLNRGFDYFYGILRHVDGHEHYPKEAPYFTAKAKARGAATVWDNRTNVTAGLDKCYTTDLLTARAKKYIADRVSAAPTEPFFLYLAYDTPHAVLELPTQAYPEGGGLRGGLQWLDQPGRMINTASCTIDSWNHPDILAATYDDDRDPATPAKPWPDAYRRQATSVRRIDDCVADLLQLLADLRLDEKTLVVFSSDNGPERVSFIPGENFSPEFFRSYGPFDGIKRDLWEGGSRVPTIARWPGQIPAGRLVARPSAQWDWLPTFADAAGLPPPARVDGISLLPDLTGHGATHARDVLYFEYSVGGRTPDYADFEPERRNRARGQMQAVRLGDLVGVRYDVKSAQDEFEIYNVVADPKETKNLAADPAYAATQRRLQAVALQLRRADSDAPRPYDAALVPALGAPARVPAAGVEWHAYAGPFPWVPDVAALKPLASGTALCPDPARAAREGASGFLFAGGLRVPTDGDYSFYITTDTGAVLRLHDATIIDADFGYKGGTERTAKIRLQAGVHPIRLISIHDKSGQPTLRLEWSGPGFDRQSIPDDAFIRDAPRTGSASGR